MTTLYEKRGRRYIPVAEERQWNSYPEGAHLVVVKPGVSSTSYNINPDHASVLAVLEEHQEALATALQEAYKAKPVMTAPEMARAWNAWLEAGGKGYVQMQWPSMMDVIQKLQSEIAKRVK